MATDHYSYKLLCPKCRAQGFAAGSDNDNGSNFRVDSVSDGFKQGSYTPNPFKQTFKCDCGAQASVTRA